MNHDPAPTLILTPACPAAPAVGGTLDVLVRIQAPEQPPGAAAPARSPLRLAVVIDRSGSMSGQPLAEALRCAEHIAAGLTARDHLAVVLYDDKIQVPVPLSGGGNLPAVQRALAGVESGGSTALFDGWEQGARLLEHGPKDTLSRVVLLSDGQANRGLVDVDQIVQHCARWAERGVSTTTVGLGRDFNEDLMIRMARAGGGQQYYGRSADDLRDGFDEELQLLQALYLRKLRVRLVPADGVVAEALGGLPSGPDGHALPDLAWGAESWMMVRLHLAASASLHPGQLQTLLGVEVNASPMVGGAPVHLHQVLQLPRVGAGDWAGLPEDPLVRSRGQELAFAAQMEAAHELVRRGRPDEARRLVGELAVQVAAHPWLAAKVERLQRLLEEDAVMSVKEMRYSALKASRRLASRLETAEWSADGDMAVPAFLRRKAEEGRAAPPRDKKPR
jgi:Ca-activated chloride channel family protein